MKYIMIPILARNVMFNKASEDFLKQLEDKGINPQVKKYVKSNLRTWLINEYPGKVHAKVKRTDPDWLKKALERGDEVFDINIKASDRQVFNHWIDFLNQYPKPDSIKAISIPQLELMVKDWEKTFVKQKDTAEDGIEDLHVYDNGFRWVKITGERSLKREGKLMNHCVGGYYKQVQRGIVEIYSLRDKDNKPHITIEYNPRQREIVQIKGNSNQSVKPQYLPYLNDLLRKKYIPYKTIDETDLFHNGMFFKDGKIVRLDELQPGTKIKIDYLELNNNTTLPSGITIDTVEANFVDCVLPTNLTIEADKGVTCTNTVIQDGLTVDGDLHLEGEKIKITSLPSRLTVNGTLDIRHTKITELPEDIHFLNIMCSFLARVNGSFLTINEIQNLPKGYVVEGSLILERTNIFKLPDDLTVNGHLNLRYTKIRRLPRNLTVNGTLDILFTPINTIPDSIKYRKLRSHKFKRINGKLTNIYRLPQNTTIDGNLSYDYSPSKLILPEGLTVTGELDLHSTKIKELPKRLTVGGLVLNSYITELPNDIKFVVNMFEDEFVTKYLKKLPDNLTIPYDLYITGHLQELPENLHVKGSLYMGKQLELPDSLEVDGRIRVIDLEDDEY